jgi:hypothetical protein
MHDSLLCRAHEQWLGGTQSGRRRPGFARGDRLLDLADVRAHLAAARPIDAGATLNFTDSLLGRLCVRHQKISWTRANARAAFHDDGKPARHGHWSMISKRKAAARSRKV